MQQTVTFRHGRASAKLELLDEEGRYYSLRNVWSYDRGKGDAKAVLQEVIDYADERDLTLMLVAQQYGNSGRVGLGDTQLVCFYMKFGFETDPRHSSRRPVWMIRLPVSREKHVP